MIAIKVIVVIIYVVSIYDCYKKYVLEL